MSDLLPYCPATMRPHAQQVLAGEYDVPMNYDAPPTVLDLGANVGAFTIWATRRWPGAKVIAYEPHPENAAYWRQNCAALASSGQAQLIEAAVTDKDGEADLSDGVTNCGEASLIIPRAPTKHRVRTVAARTLPPCNLLKIDTEGCEPMILSNYPHIAGCAIILLEFHCIADRNNINQMLMNTHRLCELQNWHETWGLMKWLKLGIAGPP